MSHPKDEVAIIGGGIAGMALALCLASHSIPSTIYEMRRETRQPHHAGGGMMLCPNALRILDNLDLYQPLLQHAYPFRYVYYKDAAETTVDRYPMGGPEFGYDAVRIFRQQLVDVLTRACRERGVGIEHGKKFARVVDEGDATVTIELEGGETREAGLLVGADGIHSRVRGLHVAPGARPGFVGLAALTFAADAEKLRVPADRDYRFPVSVASSNGVFVMAPQQADGGEMFCGTQMPFDEEGQGGGGGGGRRREEILADKEGLKARLRRGEDKWPDVVRSALGAIKEETMNVWPFYMLPALGRWASDRGRVVVLGDAAHAIPPTTGQGASMAFEDAVSLALVLKAARENPDRVRWAEGVEFWQGMRRERLRDLVVLTKKLNNKRLPSQEMAKLPKEEVWFEESEGQMKWLYVPEIENKVDEWVQGKLE
ncbi:FAD-dependent urate hydroxylase [Colletotrichum sidae]|uniref:FAD-dependent urate hydroxylase n=1 Tax=Colletotrichum sidae TaxID=1347389 RepID=A0A4R8TQY5_9PEZI|nr:FAD-dependent urate hydroxylase [Colletotrichum sidae]